MKWKHTFAALAHRNYRLWFTGQLTSLLGTWMQMTAQGFLVFQLTQSPAYLGYVGFAGGIPSLIFTLYGGIIADRVSRRSLLIITQVGMMLLAFILATLTFLHVVQAWHIIVLAFALGVANAFDAPARQAFVTDMVPPEDLTNAIALNAAMFNSATAVGPAAAGVAYALFGPAWCFTINGLSFIAVIVALSLMQFKQIPRQTHEASMFVQLKEGVRHSISHPLIRTLLTVIGVTSLFGLSLTTLIPAWTVNVLGGGAAVNGFLLSARGIGAFCGAIIIASLGRTAAKGRMLLAGMLVYSICLLAFAFTRGLVFSLLFILGVGAGSIFALNLANALVQTLTPEPLRGRVMGVYTFIFFGCMPLGAVLVGTLAEHFGEPAAVAVSGSIALAFALLLRFRFPRLRDQA